MRLVPTLIVCLALATPTLAKPPLRDVPAIDNGLMILGIADEIRKSCDGINARMFAALSRINGLKSKAREMGYSDSEIKAYTSSSSEKARMRKKAENWLAGQGVSKANKAQFCAFGRQQMKQRTSIGKLLR
ncbi:MAG: DUF5333 domain-containing protein [Pelagimonas sp.]|jgi:hypothetical protein|nr:DUF5333 domain-containing protein [Pelagimonas sp.]